MERVQLKVSHGVTRVRKLHIVRVSDASALQRLVPDALASRVPEWQFPALAREVATCDQRRLIRTARSEHFPHDLVTACVVKDAAHEVERVRCQRHAVSSQGRKQLQGEAEAISPRGAGKRDHFRQE